MVGDLRIGPCSIKETMIMKLGLLSPKVSKLFETIRKIDVQKLRIFIYKNIYMIYIPND